MRTTHPPAGVATVDIKSYGHACQSHICGLEAVILIMRTISKGALRTCPTLVVGLTFSDTMQRMIIGITGSFGAGKGEVVEYLKRKGFKHYSARNFIFEEAKRRGLDIAKGREVTIPLANELRAQYGPAYIAEQLYERAQAVGGNAVIESLRATAEAKRLKELGAFILGIDADPELRFERAVKRGSETDHVDYEQWLDQERRETNPGDPTKQDIFGALRESDVVVRNDGDLEALYQQVELALAKAGV